MLMTVNQRQSIYRWGATGSFLVALFAVMLLAQIVLQEGPRILAAAVPESVWPATWSSQWVSGTETSVIPPVSEVVIPISTDTCEQMRRNSYFYSDPHNQSSKVEAFLRSEQLHTDAQTLRAIACQPQPTWINGDLSDLVVESRLRELLDGAAAAGQVPVIVLYNYAKPDSSRWNSDRDMSEYISFIKTVAAEIGDQEVWIILEPDALPLTTSYDSLGQVVRFSQLRAAVNILSAHENARVYIDVGHSDWLTIAETITYLKLVGGDTVRGFSLNVANYQPTEEVMEYGNEIAAAFPDAHYVIDTARNGRGLSEPGGWCNVLGRALGPAPKAFTDEGALDAYLWVKPPGESDGYCNGGPNAGTFWLEYALDLIENHSGIRLVP